MRTSFAPGLPAVNVDREQFQRVVVNLVDNAAEAMQDSLVKKLSHRHRARRGRHRRTGGRRLGPRRQPAKTRRDCSCPISRPRIAAPASAWRSSATSSPSTTRTIRVEDNQPAGSPLHHRSAGGWRAIAAVAEDAAEALGGEVMKARRFWWWTTSRGSASRLSGVLEDEGYEVGDGESGEDCLEALPGGELRAGAAGHLAARHGRHGSAGAHPGDRLRGAAGGGGDLAATARSKRRCKATKLGAFDFLEKPLSHRQGHGGGQERAGAPRAGAREQPRLKQDAGSRYRIIGESVPMKALRQQLGADGAAPTAAC